MSISNISMTQTELRTAIEYYLNHRVLRSKCKVKEVKKNGNLAGNVLGVHIDLISREVIAANEKAVEISEGEDDVAD